MGVYIEIGTKDETKVVLVHSFERAANISGAQGERVRVNWNKQTNDFIDLPFSYDEFKRLFSRASAYGDVIDMRKENWPALKSHLNGGLWFKG